MEPAVPAVKEAPMEPAVPAGKKATAKTAVSRLVVLKKPCADRHAGLLRGGDSDTLLTGS